MTWRVGAAGGLTSPRCHELATGAVSYRFAGSPNTYTWDADAMASMPPALDGELSTMRARELLERWDAITSLLEHGELRHPDRVLVDHDRDEVTLLWDGEQQALVIGP